MWTFLEPTTTYSRLHPRVHPPGKHALISAYDGYVSRAGIPTRPHSAPSTPIVRLIYVFSRVIRPHPAVGEPGRRGSVAMVTATPPDAQSPSAYDETRTMFTISPTMPHEDDNNWWWNVKDNPANAKKDDSLVLFPFLSSSTRNKFNRHPPMFLFIKIISLDV